jgi:hypothetical protein
MAIIKQPTRKIVDVMAIANAAIMINLRTKKLAMSAVE